MLSPRLDLSVFCLALSLTCVGQEAKSPRVAPFIDNYCSDCHDDESRKGNLDLTALPFSPENENNRATWVKVYDYVTRGEMPPKKKARPHPKDLNEFTSSLTKSITAFETDETKRLGRATRRRLNRIEYQNTLRDLLQAPWLQLTLKLPDDAVEHLYNKIGDALDMTHVQLAAYLDTADFALREVMAKQVTPPQSTLKRYYAREQHSFIRNTRKYENEPERLVIPIIDHQAQFHLYLDRDKLQEIPSDPSIRERLAFVETASQYESYNMWFNDFEAPMAGKYKLRLKSYSVWVGPTKEHHTEPGMPHRWWIPDLSDVSIGRRTEPVTLLAETVPSTFRELGKFDTQIAPSVYELEAYLLQGETIRPELGRFFKSRQGAGRFRNPYATKEGLPGVAFNWLEVEGPIFDEWPPPGHRLLFGELPYRSVDRPKVGEAPIEVLSIAPLKDAKQLLSNFIAKAYRRPFLTKDIDRFLPVFQNVLANDNTFVDAMIAAYTAVLCSPEFIGFRESPGRLDDFAIASRLSYFLQNSAPDDELRRLADKSLLQSPEILREQTDRLLNTKKSEQFIHAFLDYWLDLRNIKTSAPDAMLYGDYYLNDLLIESTKEETQAFFQHLIKQDLPVKNLVDSEFVMVNESLAKHYDLPPIEGVALQAVSLPAKSPRGGLMTQASILKVTSNGMTTSPVKRGAWIMERLLGRRPPPPPANVSAVEPDTRGATTIREQLDKHRNVQSCRNCHLKIDPPGFALESFDVMGGWRTRYRAFAEEILPIRGTGHNGQKLFHHYAQPVDASGETEDGQAFEDIFEFKRILLQDQDQLARNMVSQFAVYATGAPIRFSDRIQIEKIIERAKSTNYGVRSLIHELVQSDLFLTK